MIPSIKDIELPLLLILAEHSPRTWDECTDILSKHFKLSEHESQLLMPNGKCKVMKYRVGWAKDNLKKEGFVKTISRGVYAITDSGTKYLQGHVNENTEHVLTNIASGHLNGEGIKTAEKLSALYDCAPIQATKEDRILLVSLNKSFDQAKANGVYRRPDIYESTRKYWAIGRLQAATIKYVLGVYKGIVRSVLEVESISWTDVADDGTIFRKQRCCFDGKLLEDSPFFE